MAATVRERMTWALATALAAGALGCGSPAGTPAADATMLYSCATETRAMPYMAGMQEASRMGGFTARLMASDPAPPGKGSATWTIQITDAVAGTPVDGLPIKVTPFMPDHNHGTSIKAVVTPNGGGAYSVAPLYFFMAGYWEVTLDLTPASGATDSIVFPMCIPG